jgi:putative endonuclease
MFASLFKRLREWRSLPLGKRGERLAATWLKKRRYKIVARSAKELGGEIDLVARLAATWVFVEVKTRTSADLGEPWEAVGAVKEKRIAQAARLFLHRRKIRDVPIRFDVISIVWPKDVASEPEVVHYPDAFQPGGI